MNQFNSLPKFVQGHGNPKQILDSGVHKGETRELHEGSWEIQHVYIQSYSY